MRLLLQTPTPAPSFVDERVLLLEEVDFKWLMAGQGWWINSTRLHSDPHYAADLLKLASSTESSALHQCAALLQGQCRCD